MKRIIILAMVLVMLLASIGGCWPWYGPGGREEGGGHDRGGSQGGRGEGPRGGGHGGSGGGH